MPLIRIDDLQSRALDPYRNLRTTNLTRFSGRFIAESRPLVLRLLASDVEVESVLLDEAFLEEAAPLIPESVTTLVIPSGWVQELIGFNFHRGYLACGIRPRPGDVDSFLAHFSKTPSVTEPSVIEPSLTDLAIDSDKNAGVQSARRWTGAMMVGVQDPENLGSILRSCSALGINDIFMGPNCVDPFARRVLRVSMGNAFKLRFYDVKSVESDLAKLHSANIESIAACLADDSEELSTFTRERNSLILFGNEAHGIPVQTQQICTRRLKIAMDLETDSLNVSVAAGIILHNLCRIC